MSDLIINDANARRERRATPIYVNIQLPPSDEQIEQVKEEFEKSLRAALEVGEKIPYTPDGAKRVQELFEEACAKILPNAYHISVTIEP